MADNALSNALKQRGQLLDERARISQRMTEINEQVAQIDRFVAEWRRFAGEDAEATSGHESESGRAENPPKEEVGNVVETILTLNEAPMGRAALFNALRASGIELQGKDPAMILSTMMWRMQDRFVRIPGHGYWLKDKPYRKAGYDPNDLISAFT